MKIQRIWACALGLSLALTACASQEPASNLIDDATASMNDAAVAKDCAEQTYALAQKALEEAKKAQEDGDIDTARQKARLAQTLAKQAKEEAQLNEEDCQRRKNAADAVTEIFAQDELSQVQDMTADSSFGVIYFDFDESFLSSSALETLKKNVTVLKNNPSMNVILGSHTDERGTTEYNLALSQKRGNSVKDHAQSMGIDGSRMSVVPYGKEKPASIGSREQDYALNRRVEFIKR